MPHDATPPNGRMYGAGMPGGIAALVFALLISAAAVAVAAATHLLAVVVPALAAVGLGCGIYALVARARRRARFGIDWKRIGAHGRRR